MLGRNVSGESFVTHGRINERGGKGREKSAAHGAESAALLVRIGLRRLMIAIVLRRVRLHFRAAIRFLNFGDQRLARDRGDGERTAEEQTEQDAENPSHTGTISCALSAAREI
jgi:hypothetical protein